jgi:hypothetical protein
MILVALIMSLCLTARTSAKQWRPLNGLSSTLRKLRDVAVTPMSTGGLTKNYSIKVVTDIDDTIVSSGGLNIFGINLGGVDNQYKRGTFYPGVIQVSRGKAIVDAACCSLRVYFLVSIMLLLTLSPLPPTAPTSTSPASTTPPSQFNLELSSASSSRLRALPAKMAVLTARAKEFKFALEVRPGGKLCSAFRDLGKSNGVDWGIGEVYYGSVNEWIFQAQKGLRKFLNFEIMLRSDMAEGLTCKYIIVGDTGEKDEDAAERIISKYPSKVRAVFLHAVCLFHLLLSFYTNLLLYYCLFITFY